MNYKDIKNRVKKHNLEKATEVRDGKTLYSPLKLAKLSEGEGDVVGKHLNKISGEELKNEITFWVDNTHTYCEVSAKILRSYSEVLKQLYL